MMSGDEFYDDEITSGLYARRVPALDQSCNSCDSLSGPFDIAGYCPECTDEETHSESHPDTVHGCSACENRVERSQESWDSIFSL